MSVALAGLIHTYGYWAVAGGTLLEGETVLISAAAAASRGYLWLPAVVAIAAVCGFIGDQLFFLIGHRYGTRLVARIPSLQPRIARVQALLRRHDAPAILAIRFMYGLRIAGPIALGTSGVHWARFAVFNFLGAVLWALLISGLGYGIGQGLTLVKPMLGDFDADEIWGLALILGTVPLWLLAKHIRRARHR